MKSVGQQIKQCAGLLGTKDIDEWETGFLTNLVAKTREGEDTRYLTHNQLEALERLYRKHFA